MIIQAVVCAAGIAAVAHLRGPALLTGLGLAYSAGTIGGAGSSCTICAEGCPRWRTGCARFCGPSSAPVLAVPVWQRRLRGQPDTERRRTRRGRRGVCVSGGALLRRQAAMQAREMRWLAGACSAAGLGCPVMPPCRAPG